MTRKTAYLIIGFTEAIATVVFMKPRVTGYVEDKIIARAKARAALDGITFSEAIEKALKEYGDGLSAAVTMSEPTKNYHDQVFGKKQKVK